jgi:hypothetical protein
MSVTERKNPTSILFIGMSQYTFADLSSWFRHQPNYCILANLPSLRSIATIAYKAIDFAILDLDVPDSENIESWVTFCHCLRQARVVALYNSAHHKQVQLAYIKWYTLFHRAAVE